MTLPATRAERPADGSRPKEKPDPAVEKPDPAVELARAILYNPWPATAQARLRRPFRRDYKGPRKQIPFRLRTDLAGELEGVVRESGLSTNEVLTLLVGAFLRRRDRV